MREITYGPGGFDPSKPNNNIVSVEEHPDAPQLREPLDPTGTLAALLVVVGTLTLTDAANGVHLTPEDLIAEAEAWAL